MHAIRKLRESGHATVADYEKLLAPNVVFHSPVLIRALEGRAVVAKIFRDLNHVTRRCIYG
jgi:hypothetical protein